MHQANWRAWRQRSTAALCNRANHRKESVQDLRLKTANHVRGCNKHRRGDELFHRTLPQSNATTLQPRRHMHPNGDDDGDARNSRTPRERRTLRMSEV
ncbi:MAG: hypothetical protein SFV81_09490 [Pirellulaceae bacterium]|nr:hypothetical protein [Pirellulaceae bacterium]